MDFPIIVEKSNHSSLQSKQVPHGNFCKRLRRKETGPLTVVTPSGTLNSSGPFWVTPQLKSFTPLKGPVGTQVTITGVSLTQTSVVSFDGVAAEFTVNSDLELSATVPLGATTGSITITTTGGSAASKARFTVTQ